MARPKKLRTTTPHQHSNGAVELHANLWDPFNLIVPLLGNVEKDPNRAKAINASINADILGGDPVPQPPSAMAATTMNLMNSIMALYSSLQRFGTFEAMFRYYPWKGKISKAEHFRSAYYLFVHESYILEERLKAFFACTEAAAKEANISIDLADIRRGTLKLHISTFGDAVKMRGRHVHKEDFVPDVIERVSLLELLTSYGKRTTWQPLYAKAINRARTEWINHCVAAKTSSESLVGSAFKLTRAVWSETLAS